MGEGEMDGAGEVELGGGGGGRRRDGKRERGGRGRDR